MSGRCCATGWAGVCSGPSAGQPWLVVERLPAYAPGVEPDPTEGLWSNLKAVELANLTSSTLAESSGRPITASTASYAPRISPNSFLRHAGLSV